MKIINHNPIFFITPNPNRAIGLEKIIKNYYIICSQKSDIVDYLKKEKIPVLCLNDNKIKNSGKILADERVIKYIKEKSGNKKANVISFKPSPMIQKICDDNKFNYLGNDWKLNRKLEDKIEFVEITRKLKIPNANSKVIKVGKNDFAEYVCRLKNKNKFVIQLPRGFSGNSTFFIENKKDLDKILKKYKNRKIKLSKYLKGETYTVNACIAKNKILISQPIFQITGLSAYNKNKFGTCGNDYVYSQKLKREEKKKIFDYTKKVGEYIKSLNYKGIFGLDFVVSNNKANLIEINPRIIGSMPFFTKLQIKNKEMPFLLSHILEFASDLIPPNLPLLRGENFNASQLILRNTKNNPIKITKNLKSGIYEIEENKLVFKEEAYYIKRNLNKSEFLIQCAAKNSIINPDMEYANIQVNYGIMESEQKFRSCFKKIIEIVLKSIKY